MNVFSLDSRRDHLELAADNVVDLVIVGAGITGSGVAREAALAGYRVVLLDKGDFASGTSSRSSKLIHGGVRYLAQGDVPLVKEAARERAVLRRIAPHLAQPVRMLIPVSSRRGKLKMAAGLWTFDRLAGEANEARHEVLDREEVLAAEPRLRSEAVTGGLAYVEFVTNDARLTLETVKSAAAAGAWVSSYAEVVAIESDPLGVRVVVDDRLGDGRLIVRARCLVNAAGPWFDRVRGLSAPRAAPMLQLTRGIHLVFPRHRLPVEHAVILRAPDGRSTFVVPSGRYAYVGTTDTIYEGAPEEPGVSVADAAYLLSSVAATFADPPSLSEVVGTWSGVRPLLRSAGKAPSEISRRDEIHTGPGPIVSIAGGKLTTYRRMAERVLSKVREASRLSPSVTVDSSSIPLVGGNLEAQRTARLNASRVADAALADRLWATYGAEARTIVERLATDVRAAERAGGLASLTLAELDFCVEQEMVASLDDLLRRRTTFGLFDIAAAASAAPDVARLLGDRLGWEPERVRREADYFCRDRVAELATVQSTAA